MGIENQNPELWPEADDGLWGGLSFELFEKRE